MSTPALRLGRPRLPGARARRPLARSRANPCDPEPLDEESSTVPGAGGPWRCRATRRGAPGRPRSAWRLAGPGPGREQGLPDADLRSGLRRTRCAFAPPSRRGVPHVGRPGPRGVARGARRGGRAREAGPALRRRRHRRRPGHVPRVARDWPLRDRAAVREPPERADPACSSRARGASVGLRRGSRLSWLFGRRGNGLLGTAAAWRTRVPGRVRR